MAYVRLADIFGRRLMYATALALFFCFSLGCGFSQNLQTLIACRALQGVGGAGLYVLPFVILPEIVPPQLRALLGALFGAVVAISGTLGPILGGVISRYNWRWIFWIK